jgi:hypothetical protein
LVPNWSTTRPAVALVHVVERAAAAEDAGALLVAVGDRVLGATTRPRSSEPGLRTVDGGRRSTSADQPALDRQRAGVADRHQHAAAVDEALQLDQALEPHAAGDVGGGVGNAVAGELRGPRVGQRPPLRVDAVDHAREVAPGVGEDQHVEAAGDLAPPSGGPG